MIEGHSLPPGWVWTRIVDLAEYVTSGSRDWSQFYSKSGDTGALFIRTEDIKSNRLDLRNIARVVLPERTEGKRTLVHNADLLVTITGANVGRCAVAPNILPEAYVSQSVALVRLTDPRLARFVHLAAQTVFRGHKTELEHMAYGIGRPVLNLENIRNLPVPVAPLPEQHRITEKTESYFTGLDDAVATLERVQRNLKRYRASVLKAAVEGQLVPTEAELARREGRGYEPASALLERVLAERRDRWEASGCRARYAEPSMPDTTELPELPNGWCWSSAEALSDPTRPITYGVIKLGAEVEHGIPVLRSSNVRHLRLDLGYVKAISERIEAEFRRTRLRGHEVLITVRGTLGGVAVAPDTCRDFNISREVAMIALVDERLAATVATFVASPNLQAWMLRRTRGITYQGVNIETLKALPIPLPPLEEQRRIVDEVGRLLSVAEATSTAVHTNIRRCRQLRQAILKWAFEGKLADQDQNDEPASALLERIRAERAESVPKKSRLPNGRARATA